MTYVMQGNRTLLSGLLIVNKNNEVLLLYRSEYNHWETPGGKVEIADCVDKNNVTLKDLEKTALREAYEELGRNLELNIKQYLGFFELTLPNGALAISHKFVAEITSGQPIINEPRKFSKLEYLAISNIEKNKLSPTTKLFVPNLKEYLRFN